ncbi:MAG: DUF4129 domain-containing protein [Cytophagaceae bacterium]|nr:DUF4129 domain-containing protein [Cytophagaceae bacterium]
MVLSPKLIHLAIKQMRHIIFLFIFCASTSSFGFTFQAKLLPSVALQQEANADAIHYDQSNRELLSFDEKTLEQYQSDPDFDYTETEDADNWWTRFKNWLNDLYMSFLRWLFGDGAVGGFWGGFLQILPYVLLALLLMGLVWIFLRMDSKRLAFEKIKAPQMALGDDEDIIQNQDIEALIQSALAHQNYRLAVRYYYLLTLQKLSGKQLIDWQAQKTNHDYIYEIKDSSIRHQFRRVTDLYDYIWYGNFTVDASAFAKAQGAFNTLNQNL